LVKSPGKFPLLLGGEVETNLFSSEWQGKKPLLHGQRSIPADGGIEVNKPKQNKPSNTGIWGRVHDPIPIPSRGLLPLGKGQGCWESPTTKTQAPTGTSHNWGWPRTETLFQTLCRDC
jgi:hypothetical protein